MSENVTENLSLFIDSMIRFPGMVSVKNSSLEYIFVNDRYLDFTGLKREEVLGKKEYEIFGIKYINSNSIEQNILENGETYTNTHRIEYNGKESHLRVLKYRILSDNKFYVVILSTDIGREVEEQIELKKNEIYLRTIVDYSDSVMAVLDEYGNIKNFLKSDRIINKPSTAFRILISEIIDVNTSKNIIENIKLVLKNRKELNLRKSLSYKGQQFFLKDSYYPIVNDDGSVTEVGIIRQDISKSREIEEAYTNLVNNSSFGLFVIQDNKIVFVNNRLSSIIGFSREEIEMHDIDQFIKILIPIADRERVLKGFLEIVENRIESRPVELPLYTKNGTLIWIEFTWNRIFYNGRIAIQAGIVDITEKKHAISNLEKYKHIVNASHEGIIFIDERRRITLVNGRITEFLQLPGEKILGHTMDFVVGAGLYESALTELYDECFKFGHFSKTEQWIQFSDEERYIEISINPYKEKNRRVTGAIIVLRDITDEIETDLRMNEIKQNERRKIAMELHDGLTHELLGISINAKILSQKLDVYENSNEVTDMLTSIKDDLNSAIASARNLSQGLSPIHELYTSLGTMISDLKLNVERRYNIICNTDIDTSIEIRGDRVLENLYYIIEESITNAVKHAKSNEVDIEIKKEKDFAIINIRNKGKGFNKKEIQKGMGLKIIKMRCRSISASLDIKSSEEAGTIVSCKLKL